MRMHIKTMSNGTVRLRYTDLWNGERIERTFHAAKPGGYVRERIGNDWRQVCYYLDSMGSTLIAPEHEALADLIRREYRRMYRRESAFLKAY